MENNKSKVLIATVVAFLLMFAATTITTSNSFAQESLEESDGLMTARINGEIFTTGQTIAVSGTVEERDLNSRVSIQVIDPNGETVKTDSAAVTADNTFTSSFVAGEREQFSTYPPMEQSGNYRMTLTFFAPGEADELDFTEDLTSEIEFVFAYTHVEEQSQQEQQGGQGTITTPQQPQQEDGPRRTVNVTALNAIIIQGLEQVQRLSNTLVAENASDPILGQLQSIQDSFMNLRGNLTGVTPLAQGEGLANNTTAATTTTPQPQPSQQSQEQQPSSISPFSQQLQ